RARIALPVLDAVGAPFQRRAASFPAGGPGRRTGSHFAWAAGPASARDQRQRAREAAGLQLRAGADEEVVADAQRGGDLAGGERRRDRHMIPRSVWKISAHSSSAGMTALRIPMKKFMRWPSR